MVALKYSALVAKKSKVKKISQELLNEVSYVSITHVLLEIEHKIWDIQYPRPNQLQIPLSKYVAGKSRFWSMKIDKIRGEGISRIVHCPSEG